MRIKSYSRHSLVLQGYNATIFAYGMCQRLKFHGCVMDALGRQRNVAFCVVIMQDKQVQEKALLCLDPELVMISLQASFRVLPSMSSGYRAYYSRHVFQGVQSMDLQSWKVECSFLELYNEEIRDLLSQAKNLQIHEGKDGIYVDGSESVDCFEQTHVLELLVTGETHRATSATRMNEVCVALL